MKKYKYMHMMDGHPAYFEGGQLVFSSRNNPIPLVPTLADIHRQRKKSKAWRLKQGCADFSYHYSHRRVIV